MNHSNSEKLVKAIHRKTRRKYSAEVNSLNRLDLVKKTCEIRVVILGEKSPEWIAKGL